MRDTMDLFVSLGLRDAGYDTVSVDDCYISSRSPNGTLIPDPATFPSGMAALADYAHSRGLKFGLYSSNSPKTCDGRPGSFGYESQDAATYAAWGVDLLKYDNCAWLRCEGIGYARLHRFSLQPYCPVPQAGTSTSLAHPRVATP
jgi:alpha-galactosidase